MKNSYSVCILTTFVFLNTMRTKQQSRQGANDVYINFIDLSNQTLKFNDILTEFILGFGKQQKLSLRQIVFEKVTNRYMFSDIKSLCVDPSELFDCAKSKACCLAGLTHLSVSSEEDRDDTIFEFPVFVLTKVVENWRSYGDDEHDLVYASVSQAGFNISFYSVGKSAVFLSFRQFPKEDCANSFMSLNITANLKSYDAGCNQTHISKGRRK